MPNKITGAIKEELSMRAKSLPKEYQIAFHEITKYLFQFASKDADVLNMQIDILDMFKTGAQEVKDVFDVLGDDIVGFCDGLLEEIPEQTWIGKAKAAMNHKINKKLVKREENKK